jgi:hypothetical protein
VLVLYILQVHGRVFERRELVLGERNGFICVCVRATKCFFMVFCVKSSIVWQRAYAVSREKMDPESLLN